MQSEAGTHAGVESRRTTVNRWAGSSRWDHETTNWDLDRTLTCLIQGGGDFIEPLHDVLYDADMKLGVFAYFCALELYGTLKPEDCPPNNGRMAKA